MLTYLLTVDGLMFLDENGKAINLRKDHPKFETISRLVQNPKTTITEIKNEILNEPPPCVNKQFTEKLAIKNSILWYRNDKPLPPEVAKVVLNAMDDESYLSVLLSFIESTMENPLIGVQDSLFNALVNENLTLNSEGQISGYLLTDSSPTTRNKPFLKVEPGKQLHAMRNHMQNSIDSGFKVLTLPALLFKEYIPGTRVFVVNVSAKEVCYLNFAGTERERIRLTVSQVTVKAEYVDFYDQNLTLVKNRAAYFKNRQFGLKVRNSLSEDFEYVFATDEFEQALLKFRASQVFESRLVHIPSQKELDYKCIPEKEGNLI